MRQMGYTEMKMPFIYRSYILKINYSSVENVSNYNSRNFLSKLINV